MKPVVISLPGNEVIGQRIASSLDYRTAEIKIRKFPDGETYVRFPDPDMAENVIFICSLDRPDEKFLQLVFACSAARDQGASGIGLVAPYLGYMRQDIQFMSGEAVTAKSFAKALSPSIDWLITVDPHLHRIHSLSEIYSLPTAAVHSASLIAQWILENVEQPLLIGPDEESEQWLGSIAAYAKAPHIVLKKKRFGDTRVSISIPDISGFPNRTPVIVDDIISTGHSIIETTKAVLARDFKNPICIGVHAIFAGNAYEDIVKSGIVRILTCNTIQHFSNAIDITPNLLEQLGKIQG